MSAHELRSRAQHREEKSRLEALWSIGLGIMLFLLFGWSAAKAQNIVTGIGWGLLSLWSVYFARQAHRWIWPGRLPPDATLDATVSFYRGVLERRRDFERHSWRRTGLPFLCLGIAIVLAPPLIRAPQLSLKAAPFFVLLAIWLAAYFPIRKRKHRMLQQEIDELRRFDSGNPL